MSEMLCLHDAENKHVGNVCVPGPFEYRVATHRRGARKWEPVGELLPTVAEAFRDVGKILESDRYRHINRVGIWACETGESYYDPHQIYEVAVR